MSTKFDIFKVLANESKIEAEILTVESETEISKERHISAEKKQQITDEFRLYNNIIMKYQKITNLLENTLSQPSKFRTKTWVDITYNTNSQIKFKTAMLKSNLCEYSDACILVKGTITVPNTESTPAVTNNGHKKDI